MKVSDIWMSLQHQIATKVSKCLLLIPVFNLLHTRNKLAAVTDKLHFE